jgi:hypothetical protein
LYTNAMMILNEPNVEFKKPNSEWN